MSYSGVPYKGLTILSPEPSQSGASIHQSNFKAIADSLESLEVGLSGYSGYSGISGASGYSGYSGYSGSSGYSGHSGTSGYSGYSGKSGSSGFSGYSGSVGTTGTTGTSGFSGYSGSSGISGFSGSATNIANLAFTGGPFIHNDSSVANYAYAKVTSITSADLDVYTVSSGYKAIPLAVYAYNANGSSRDVTMKFVRSSVTYPLETFPSTVTTLSTSNIIFSYFIPILKVGDKLIATITGAGVDIYVRFMLLPDTYPINDFLSTSISASGTLYTCPAGKSAMLLGTTYPGSSTGSIGIYNTTGGSSTISIFNVPSGESVGNGFRLRTQNISNNTLTSLTGYGFLNAGDTLQYTATITGPGYIYGAYVEFA